MPEGSKQEDISKAGAPPSSISTCTSPGDSWQGQGRGTSCFCAFVRVCVCVCVCVRARTSLAHGSRGSLPHFGLNPSMQGAIQPCYQGMANEEPDSKVLQRTCKGTETISPLCQGQNPIPTIRHLERFTPCPVIALRPRQWQPFSMSGSGDRNPSPIKKCQGQDPYPYYSAFRQDPYPHDMA